MQGTVPLRGTLRVRKMAAQKAPLAWRIRNTLRWSYLWGLFVVILAKMFSKLTGIVTITTDLRLRVRYASTGQWVDFGVVSRRVVTDAGVAALVNDWYDNSKDISLFNYHGFGTGTTAEAVGQTALVTESTTALNPDSTRPTGTKSKPTAPQLQSVGTATFDAIASIAEHGLFDQAATGGGTLWDRSQFTAVGVASGDSIQATYTVTFNSGG